MKKKKYKIKKNGTNYKLPSNYTVLNFLYLILTNFIKKVIYGLFFEKKWMIAICENRLGFKNDEILFSKFFKKIALNKK